VRGFSRWIGAAAVAAVLGFGAAQTFASPVEAQTTTCNATTCSTNCKANGFFGGACLNGRCACYTWIP
jgi:hypothetical protein